MSVCALCECLVSQKSEESIGSGTGLITGYKLPRGCLGPNLGPLQKPQVLGTIKTDVSSPLSIEFLSISEVHISVLHFLCLPSMVPVTSEEESVRTDFS